MILSARRAPEGALLRCAVTRIESSEVARESHRRPDLRRPAAAQARRAPPMVSGQPRTAIETLLVRWTPDAGITGWGEGFGHRVVAGHADGDRPHESRRSSSAATRRTWPAHERTVPQLHGAGRTGPVMYGLSAMTSLWDIAAAGGQPLQPPARNGTHTDLPAYASLRCVRRADEVARRIGEALTGATGTSRSTRSTPHHPRRAAAPPAPRSR